MDTYKRLPVTFSHGNGVWIHDTDGKRYLDALCGISVTSLGHNHPAVTKAIINQAQTLLHTSNLYRIDAQQKLATRLCQVAGMDRVFFSNSGAEANEAAIKLARLHAHNKGMSDPTIITMSGSFHGRTLATLAATGNKSIQQGFEPLPTGFLNIPFDDADAVEQVLKTQSNIAALLIEPVQGEGGIRIASTEYLHRLQQLCHQHQVLFMLDEIQTGNGRCGSYFAFQGLGLSPDVVTTAKGLGNGVPIGACMAKGLAAETLAPGKHGSTFGGNPLATAAALAVIDSIETDHLAQRAGILGDKMIADFKVNLAENPAVVDIRGCGLMIGIELDKPCTELVSKALEAGLLINVTAEKVIRLLPPLIMSDENADQIVTIVTDLINQFAPGS